MMQDPAFLNSGIMPPILLPLKSPSHLTNVTPEFIHKHPEFKPNLPALYMTPTSYKFRISQDRSTDHYITYASRIMTQLQFWQKINLDSFAFNTGFLNQPLLILDHTLLILLLPLSKEFTIKLIKLSWK